MRLVVFLQLAADKGMQVELQIGVFKVFLI
jgi:hypothetical protein